MREARQKDKVSMITIHIKLYGFWWSWAYLWMSPQERYTTTYLSYRQENLGVCVDSGGSW